MRMREIGQKFPLKIKIEGFYGRIPEGDSDQKTNSHHMCSLPLSLSPQGAIYGVYKGIIIICCRVLLVCMVRKGDIPNNFERTRDIEKAYDGMCIMISHYANSEDAIWFDDQLYVKSSYLQKEIVGSADFIIQTRSITKKLVPLAIERGLVEDVDVPPSFPKYHGNAKFKRFNLDMLREKLRSMIERS